MRQFANKDSRAYWNHGYALLLRYRRKHKSVDIKKNQVIYDGFDLGEWLSFYRDRWNKDRLDVRQQKMLLNLGVEKFPSEMQWNRMYQLAEEYLQKYGDIKVNYTYKTDNGVLLGAWIDKQKKLMNKLPIEQQQKLKKLGL